MSNSRNTDLDGLAEMFKCLGNPQRLRIFIELTSCRGPGTRCDGSPAAVRRRAGELGKNLSLAVSTVSHHLKELRQAGLMHVERCGQRIDCWISAKAVRQLARFFAGPGRTRTGGGDKRAARGGTDELAAE